jgi:type II secretory pathway pseudopilin PulG
MKQRGFTVVELLAVTVLLIIIGVVFWTQKSNIEVASRDDKRKTSINAIYYGLEEVYYPATKSYPLEIDESTLPSIDKTLLKDPNGVLIGKTGSDYRYIPTNCTADKCQSYSLRTTLENEADFVKNSRH